MNGTLKTKENKISTGNFSLDGSNYKTGDAAFIPATPLNLQISRANTNSKNSHSTQHTGVKQSALFFM